MRHEKRKLPLAVTHLTSPGFVGGRSRQELNLRGGGPSRVITDMAVLGFDAKTHAMSVISLHPGIRVEDLMENTGFPLHIPKDVPTTPLPSPEELRLLREEIDPKGTHLK
jgi:acyl CoA:acetate/3-ketoacid CoA transferase beta subunit